MAKDRDKNSVVSPWRPLAASAIILSCLVLLFLSVFMVWWLFMPSSDTRVPVLELTPAEKELAARLQQDVRYLAETIGERHMHRPGTMETTAAWIEHRLEEIGLVPTRHSYQLQGERYRGRSADNLIAEVAGTSYPERVVMVGAHYDTVPGSPGANDNSSAVAVLLALAEWFYQRPQAKTLRFVAFANEEPPFFQTPNMGSYAYAQTMKNLGEQPVAMLSLDGLGYYSDEPGSQSYPAPGIGLIYPDRANFIALVTRLADLRLMKRSLKAFREETALPAEGAALPEFVPGVDWSDHWSFWQHGFPAFLVTDTLPFRDPYYHTAGDTADRLDYARMALVAQGLKGVLTDLGSPPSR